MQIVIYQLNSDNPGEPDISLMSPLSGMSDITDKGDKMDILDIMAQMERIGQLVAFAPKPDEPGNWVILVKLHEADNVGNWYYMYIVDESDNSVQVMHSSTNWVEAAKVFQGWTNLI